SGNAREHLTEISNSKTKLKEKVDEIKNELENIKKKYADFILASDEYLSIETQKAEAPLKFATSENAFIAEGWIPSDQYAKMENNLKKEAQDHIYITKLKEETEKNVPSALHNPGPTRSFELITNMFAIPEYKEFDPTMLIAIAFPVFYGFMLGDIGYGALTLALVLALKMKFKTEGWQALLNIIGMSSIFSIFFGFCYGEIFGEKLWVALFGHGYYTLFGIFPLANRFESDWVQTLLIVSILIGLVHINLGFILGFINEKKVHGLKFAVLEKISWMVLEVGGFMAFLALVGILPPYTLYLGGGILVVSLVMLSMSEEGPMAVTHIPFLLSNIISYLRLLAIGLASVGVAMAVNKLAIDTLIPMIGGMMGTIAGLLVLVIGHTINFLLGILAPFMHSLRLHYVEFFTKFYSQHGGGIEYKPFGYIRKYLED
ncbi:MAG: V-type ATP synthase subunit I, partial [Methanosarcinales archaeon]